jgi:hypothetical protein
MDIPSSVKAVVRLDPSKPRGLPRGVEGEVRSGFEFFRRDGESLHFITLELRQDPVLTAVAEEQLRLWKNVVAVPVYRKFRNGSWVEIAEEGR